jgi:DNA polymerase-3 subunit gamma/tau
MSEFYKSYRPRSLKTVLGQEAAVASLQKLMDANKVPHTILLTGPSGTGKTTIARILKDFLECGDQDFLEVNCADFKGIDMVRDIRRSVNLNPISGLTRVWLIDEAHKLTGDAQNAFLKLLEDTPRHAYFMLATTDPQKLIRTIHTRATQIKLVPLVPDALERVVQRVVDKETLAVSSEVVKEIVEAAEGSARKALVILEQISLLEGDAAQISAIQTTTFNKEAAIDLARELLFGNKDWMKVAGILRAIKEEDPEGVRYCILGYARAILVGSADGKAPNPKFAPKAFKVIDIFSKNFYDSKQPGLAAACYEAVCM